MSATTWARAWAVQRRDGLVLGFTDHDGELSFENILFRPDRGMSASSLVQAVGLSVDNSEAEGALSDDAISEADLTAGRWDGAGVRLWEVDWRDTGKRRLLFRGRLGEIVRSGGVFRAELRGLSDALAVSNGRVFQRGCSARLGDRDCGVRLSAPGFSVELELVEAVEAVEGGVFRFAGAVGSASGWFDHGTLEVMSGEAAGQRGAIRRDVALPGGGRQVELWSSLPVALQPGDRIRLVAGCDKSGGTCRAKFANFLNFRGFPHLPSEDWLMAPEAGDRRG